MPQLKDVKLWDYIYIYMKHIDLQMPQKGHLVKSHIFTGFSYSEYIVYEKDIHIFVFNIWFWIISLMPSA